VVEAFSDHVRDRTCACHGLSSSTPLTCSVLITGPSPDGIGAETASCLAKAQPRLIVLAGRSPAKIQPVIDDIEAFQVPVEFVRLDLSDQNSVRGAVDTLRQRGTKIDVLINNAAIMACPYALTTDGIEMQFATNHLGPFLFTNLLLQANLITERIVNLNSSASVRSASYLLEPLSDMTYGNGKSYDAVRAYGTSKMAVLLYTRELAAKLRPRNISVFTLNPGSIKSPLQRYMSDEMRQAALATARREDPDFVVPVRKTLQQGCSTQLRAALDPFLVAQTGAYLDDCQVVEPQVHKDAYPATANVWKLSEEMTGSAFGS